MIQYSETLAKGYNEFHSRGNQSQKFQNYKIKHYLNLNHNSVLLDAGCGAGRLFGLSEMIGKMIGVEKSADMYEQALKQPYEVEIYNQDYKDFLNQQTIKVDSVVFSYTLHQFDANKKNQIQILHDTFKKLGCKKILLITASDNQFKESILNQLSPQIDAIDRDRYLFKQELLSEFRIPVYEEETIYKNISRKDYKTLVEHKYISTLQLITDVEFNNILQRIDQLPENLILPDYYTYILLEQK